MKITFDLKLGKEVNLLVTKKRIKAADILGSADVKVKFDNISFVDNFIKSMIKSKINELWEKGIRGTITIDDEVIEIKAPNSEILEDSITKTVQDENKD